MEKEKIIKLDDLYGKSGAKIMDWELYAKEIALMVHANDIVILTGKAPMWLYLMAMGILVERGVQKVYYSSPVLSKFTVYSR